MSHVQMDSFIISSDVLILSFFVLLRGIYLPRKVVNLNIFCFNLLMFELSELRPVGTSSSLILISFDMDLVFNSFLIIRKEKMF